MSKSWPEHYKNRVKMKQTTDELKSIIENAPKGATYFACDNGTNYWYKVTRDDGEVTVYFYRKGEWVFYNPDCEDMVGLRSLDDIREIIELREHMK